MSKSIRNLVIIFAVVAMSSYAASNRNIKKPNVSGQFYPASPFRLSSQINQMIKEAKVKPYKQPIDIIIAPHAGYVYSGSVAAYSFKSVSHQKPKTIVILAPSHYYGFDGISVWDKGGFQTPLGIVDVDEDFAGKLTQGNQKVYYDPKAFEKEHSLEVEIPFIQKTFKDAKIVPVVMGQPHPDLLLEFAKSLKQVIADRQDVLVVVSTDLSHYHDDAFARKMDHRTIQAIKDMKVDQLYLECQRQTMEMCGCIPVVTALLYAQLKEINNIDVLKYANSGDVSGDKDRVVGYSSIVLYKDDGNGDVQKSVKPLSVDQKRKLLDIARQSITSYLTKGAMIDVEAGDKRLLEEEGAFVSIYKKGALRGCIGHIIGRGPLSLTVRNVAISSAIRDHRFKPLSKDELDNIEIEISVLSKPVRVKSVEEIKMGTHGVIVSRGNKSGVFLPQVAESTGWTKERFLSELCAQKAGLPPDCWKDPKKTNIEIYTAEVFSEKDLLGK